MSMKPAQGRPGSHCSLDQSGGGDACSAAGCSGQPKRKHLQAVSRQGHHAPHPAAIHFIINYCLANKCRVRFKNTGNFKAGGIPRTVGSQPLTQDYKYPPGCGPSSNHNSCSPARNRTLGFFPKIQHNLPGMVKMMKWT